MYTARTQSFIAAPMAVKVAPCPLDRFSTEGIFRKSESQFVFPRAAVTALNIQLLTSKQPGEESFLFFILFSVSVIAIVAGIILAWSESVIK